MVHCAHCKQNKVDIMAICIEFHIENGKIHESIFFRHRSVVETAAVLSIYR